MRNLFTIAVFCVSFFQVFSQEKKAFQPYNTQGDNLIHITTADFDGVGARDYVVAMTVEGKLIAFKRPDQIDNPEINNRLWEYSELPTMAYRIIAAEVVVSSMGDEILLPGTDGHLRVLSATGSLLLDIGVSDGALYTAAVAKDSDEKIIIATSGVDGLIYFFDTTGALLTTVRPKTSHSSDRAGVIRHLVTGDFDGNGSDEIVSFINRKSFTGNCFFDVIDVSTFQRPSYYNGVSSENSDDVVSLGFTDKQLPHAYDMDGDGNLDVVGHWGVFHPESGAGTQLFSTMLTANEKITLGNYNDFAEQYLKDNHGFKSKDKQKTTNTGKYLMQHGIPGDFDNDGKAELFTVYGDDLFLSDYNSTNKSISISDYTWAHTDYHFSDGARLENRNGGADKIVLSGPINGDDHFYVVDITNTDWRTDARIINGRGSLGEIDQNLDELTQSLKTYSGTAAAVGDKPISFVHYFASYLGWEMTPENCEIRAQAVYDAQQNWYNKIGGQVGYRPSRIRLVAEIAAYIYGVSNDGKDPDVTPEGMVEFCRALAQKGVYFQLKIGHGSHQHITAENLADCYEASVVDGECYMMARTRELSHYSYFDVYKPHMDALLERAVEIGASPPKVMLCAKGAMFSTWTQQQTDEYFPKYTEMLVPGVENSNVNVLDWSIAERVGMWMHGDVKDWGCNVIGDNLTANRVAEWGGMRNAHVVLRQLLNAYALGASFYRITSVTSLDNPLFVRGDVIGEDKEWTQAYEKGFMNFLKIVEKGLYPNSPKTTDVKGISPVAITLHNRSNRLLEQSLKHDHHKYAPDSQDYVLGQFACWGAYTDVPETDLSSYIWSSKRRWDNMLPTSPGGFVTIHPNRMASQVVTNTWCNSAYQTNGDSWDNNSLTGAKNDIEAELLTQRNNLDFYVDGKCAWQIVQEKDNPLRYYLFLTGNNILSPRERIVQLKSGSSITGTCTIYDQLKNTNPIGTISSVNDEVALRIPKGTASFLRIELSSLPYKNLDVVSKENPKLKIYPNSVSDSFQILFDQPGPKAAYVSIYNNLGVMVLEKNIVNSLDKINMTSLPSGVYLVRVQEKSRFQTIQIIKE